MTTETRSTEDAKRHIAEADKILDAFIDNQTNHINQRETEIARPEESDEEGKRREVKRSKRRRKEAENLRVRVRAAQLADDSKWMRIDWWSSGCFCVGGLFFAVVTSALGGTLWDLIKAILKVFSDQ